MVVLVLSAITLLAFGAALAYLYPSESPLQKSGAASGSGLPPPLDSRSTSSSSSTSIVRSSVSVSTDSTQTYESYQPPNHDTIVLKNPCHWWCVSNTYDWSVLNDSAFFGVPDPMIIKAQIALESAFNPNATSRLTNSICGGNVDYGLMQVNPNCNNVNASELFIPSYNLYWGIRFWANDFLYLQQMWGSSCNTNMVTSGVLELYNGGAGYIGSTCGSFPKGMNYIGLVSVYYYPFCQDANYIPITRLLNNTSTGSNNV